MLELVLSVILSSMRLMWRMAFLSVASLTEAYTALFSRMMTQQRTIETMAILYTKGRKVEELKDLIIMGAQLQHHSERDKIEVIEVTSSSDHTRWLGYVHKKVGRVVEGFAEDLKRLSVVSRSKELSAGCLPSASYICVDIQRQESWIGYQLSLWRARVVLRKAMDGRSLGNEIVWSIPMTNRITVAIRVDEGSI